MSVKLKKQKYPKMTCGLGDTSDGLHGPLLERINWNTVLGALQLPLLLKVKVESTSLSKAMSYIAILKGIWVRGGSVMSNFRCCRCSGLTSPN